MRKHAPFRWTIEMASSEFGLAHKTMGSRIKAASIEPGTDGRYSTAQIVAAIYGDAESEKLRKLRHEANLLEIEEKERRNQLLPTDDVISVWSDYLVVMTQKIRSWNDVAENRKRDLLQDLRELKAEDFVKGKKVEEEEE